MLLRDLDGLYDTLIAQDRLPPTGYELKPVRFLVELDGDGHCQSILDTAPEKTQRYVPDVARSGTNAQAFLICDNAQYVLGLGQKDTDDAGEKARRAHGRYVEVLDTAIGDLQDSAPAVAAALRAVAEFAADPERMRAQFAQRGIVFAPNTKGEIAEASERIAFLVDGADPVAAEPVRSWWAQRTTGNMTGGSSGVCQVTGKRGALARITPGVYVERGTAQKLISANFDAALRYNAEKSRGAQISVAAAVRSHQALNWLLTDSHHCRRVGQTHFVWWLQGALDFDPFDLITRPDPVDVAAVLARPWTGRPGLSPSDQFRILGLTLTEGRVVIRFDHTSTLELIEANTRGWLNLIERHHHDGTPWWPRIDALAEAAAAPGTGAAPLAQRDRIIQALAVSAITGAALPRSLLAALVKRCRAAPVPRTNADKIDWTAVGSRLAVLHLHRHLKEDTMTENPSAGEICGRILAQLDNAQYQALGPTNRTVADRYYAGASTRPASVFPGLLRGTTAHLSKLRRQQNGKAQAAQIGISKRLSELSHLLLESGGFPTTLSLDDQADFALAYWDEQGRRKATEPDDSPAQEDTP